jgi:hypothetical protein
MMKTFWLSFVDASQPPGQQFRGVAIVDVSDADAALADREVRAKFPHAKDGAEWIAAASRKAWLMGCNPGGEMMSIELPPGTHENLPRHRILSRDELNTLGAVEREDH